MFSEWLLKTGIRAYELLQVASSTHEFIEIHRGFISFDHHIVIIMPQIAEYSQKEL